MRLHSPSPLQHNKGHNVYNPGWFVVPLTSQHRAGLSLIRLTRRLSRQLDSRVASLHESVLALVEGKGRSSPSPHTHIPSALQTPGASVVEIQACFFPSIPHSPHPLKFHFTTHKAR